MKRVASAITVISVLLFSLVVAMSSARGAENSWETKSSMHFSRTGAGAVAVNGIVYVMGGSQRYNTSDTGFSYMSINSTEAYNPATDSWVEKAPTRAMSFLISFVNHLYFIYSICSIKAYITI